MFEKQRIILGGIIAAFLFMLLLILFSDKGVLDLNALKKERDEIIQKNKEISNDNLRLYNLIKRLQTDTSYIEHIAKQEFNLIKEGEMVVTKSLK